MRLVWSALVTLLMLSSGAQGRELAGDPAGFVPAELVSVGLTPGSGVPVALLRTRESRELVPIFIGPAEARAILLALQGVEPPRPMTHDLIGRLLDTFDTRLERLLIDDLADGVFLGMLELSTGSGDTRHRVDTRPSDGLALAVRAGAGIYIAPKVVAAMRGQPWEGLPDGQVVRLLGITVIEASTEVRAALQLPDRPGVLVSQTDARAARAGIVAGSLLLAVNEQPIENPLALIEVLDTLAENEPLRLRLWHDGREREIELGEQPLLPELSI